MTTKTIGVVVDKPRIWDNPKGGQLAFIKVTFSDGEEGDVATKPEYADNHIEALKKLLNTEADFELEDKGEFKGIKQWKVKGYPGRPGSQDGQRGGGFRGRSAEEIRSIQRQTALKAAVEMRVAEMGLDGRTGVEAALTYAESFIAWLEKPAAGAVPIPEETPSSRSPASAAGPSEEQRVLGEGTSGSSVEGEGAEAPEAEAPPPDPQTEFLRTRETCHHEFQPAPRKGWVVCSRCGHAEKATP